MHLSSDIFVNKMQRNYIGSQIKCIFKVLEKRVWRSNISQFIGQTIPKLSWGPLNLSKRRPKWEKDWGTDSLLYLVLCWWMCYLKGNTAEIWTVIQKLSITQPILIKLLPISLAEWRSQDFQRQTFAKTQLKTTSELNYLRPTYVW